MKKATIKDIAAIVGVSPACVSMILNDRSLSRFSEDTIQKVYQACRDTGYVSKKMQFHKNPKKAILIICPSIINPYYATLIQGMEQEATMQGYLTFIYTTYWDKNAEREILDLAANPQIAGIIFAMIPQQQELAEKISKQLPMVAVGDKTYGLNLDTVDINNYSAGQIIAAHLIELGHKHIAYISTPINGEHSSRMKRCEGLQDEYKQHCPLGSVTVYTKDVSSKKELFTIEIEHQVGYALAKKCLQETPQITAIVAINDMVAYGVRDALIDAGKRIPEDISLCGFDNIYPSHFHGIELTTIEHSITERGRSSVRLLANKLSGTSDFVDENVFTRVEYQSRLIPCSTTGPAPLPHPDND